MAKITCRLVPGQRPERIQRLVGDAIRARVPRGVRVELVAGHNADPYVVVPRDGRTRRPTSRPFSPGLSGGGPGGVRDLGRPPLYLREGGSVPIIADIKRVTGLDSLMFGLFLPEDNLHAPNEGFSLEILRKGIDTTERMLETLAAG